MVNGTYTHYFNGHEYYLQMNSKSILPLEPVGIPLVLGYTYFCSILTRGHCCTRTAIEEMGRRLLEPCAGLLALASGLPVQYISNLS